MLRRLEQKLQAVFDAAGADSWADPKKNYIGLAKIKQIVELRAQGMKIAEIARKLEVSAATVYRHLPKEEQVATPPG